MSERAKLVEALREAEAGLAFAVSSLKGGPTDWPESSPRKALATVREALSEEGGHEPKKISRERLALFVREAFEGGAWHTGHEVDGDEFDAWLPNASDHLRAALSPTGAER